MTLLNAALVNMAALFLPIAFVCLVLYGVWVWLSTRHLAPVLNRALQHIDEGFDSPFEWPVPVEVAKSRLKEVRQYQKRLWAFGGSSQRERWKERLAEIAQEYTNAIEAKKLGRVDRPMPPVV